MRRTFTHSTTAKNLVVFAAVALTMLVGLQLSNSLSLRQPPATRKTPIVASSETSMLRPVSAPFNLTPKQIAAAYGRLPIAFDRHCMHEFVLSGKPMKDSLGLATLDLAKRLLDFGFHPPTVYFPLLVDEALMVEPTETEAKESLDRLAEAFESILAEAEEDPEILRNAPYTTPVRRLDEVKATREPVVRQPL